MKARLESGQKISGKCGMPGIIDVVGYDDDDYFSTLPERVKQELSQYRTEVSDSSELRRLAEKIMLRY